MEIEQPQIMLLRILGYIVIISIIIFVAGKLVKNRFLGRREGKHLGLIEQFYLGPKLNLSLVEVQDKIILLGVTPGGITKLKEWERQEFTELKTQSTDFKSILNSFGRDRND